MYVDKTKQSYFKGTWRKRKERTDKALNANKVNVQWYYISAVQKTWKTNGTIKITTRYFQTLSHFRPQIQKIGDCHLTQVLIVRIEIWLSESKQSVAKNPIQEVISILTSLAGLPALCALVKLLEN